VQEARQALKGGEDVVGRWWENPMDENVSLIVRESMGLVEWRMLIGLVVAVINDLADTS
jgi:hypothetical protein